MADGSTEPKFRPPQWQNQRQEVLLWCLKWSSQGLNHLDCNTYLATNQKTLLGTLGANPIVLLYLLWCVVIS